MKFRARLSLFALEARENPSGPSPLDLSTDSGTTQSTTDPALTTPTSDATSIAIAGAVSGAGTTTSSDTLLTNNTITNDPLVQLP